MKIASEGKPLIALSAILTLLTRFTGVAGSKRKSLFWFGVIITGFLAYFFRDPERATLQDDSKLTSPADGTIIGIEEVDEPNFIKGPAFKISVIMSIFDVHVNRTPAAGSVAFVEHKKGLFLPAVNEATSFDNECNLVGYETRNGRILTKQIAGLFARRIVCHVRSGDLVEQGERMGMIKFSDRCELFIPKSNNVIITTKIMDKVQAGLSVLAEYTQ
jgi:phosphatidylserine decarboxylase